MRKTYEISAVAMLFVLLCLIGWVSAKTAPLQAQDTKAAGSYVCWIQREQAAPKRCTCSDFAITSDSTHVQGDCAIPKDSVRH